MSRILIAHPARLAGRLQHEFAVVVLGGGLIASISFRKHVFVITHRAAAADRRAWFLVIVVRHVTALSLSGAQRERLLVTTFALFHACGGANAESAPSHVLPTDSQAARLMPMPTRGDWRPEITLH